MSYMFESDLISKLKEYDSISSQIKILDDKKEDIRKQIKKWREVNNISEKVTITEGSDSWIIDVYTQHRRSIIDFDVLINKLGQEAPVFIKESDSNVLKITKR